MSAFGRPMTGRGRYQRTTPATGLPPRVPRDVCVCVWVWVWVGVYTSGQGLEATWALPVAQLLRC